MKIFIKGALALAATFLLAGIANAQDKKPNILVIWGDDIGYWNVSAYNLGMMGYRTPNIDRIAKGGHALHGRLWRTVMYGRTRRLRHRAKRV